MMKFKFASLFSVLTLLLFSCVGKTQKEVPIPLAVQVPQDTVKYATGFTIERGNNFTVLKVSNPWLNSDKVFSYALVPKEKLSLITLPANTYDAIVATPVENLVVTSTTHIPALESLQSLNKLKGFPDTKYISSKKARSLIENNKIKELGSNESINTEMVLEMRPDAVVGFSINNQNPVYQTLQNARTPVVYNGDWTEQTPLGKAEWIKFFGALLGKERQADSIFNQIEASYHQVKKIARTASNKPTVLSGALYKDVWYLPAGESWASQFLKDANANYLWKESEGTGSLSLGLESVMEKGKNADFWISPSQFTSYIEMNDASPHYSKFKAFNDQNVYTFAATKGETGGLLYYELAPQRPDIVLKDLVAIFHPELLPEYEPYFFKPLQK